ncbi:dynamin family protein [Acinetobacter junii]|uniref:dynamin family protein n=1 Tax=Acinetobacter junii TaxID=40215 RepID=UPI0024AC8931|nr:dynamin family protein [Acinetobacter junii]MDI6622818.1 dynamin family protein [Acinetobacter junii]
MSHLIVGNLNLETKILLLLMIKILQKIDDNEYLIHGNFNNVSLKNKIFEFKNEYLKIDKSEMVLAVVGTMKAGKSTTINAIVGSEILPNRNAPMTAIPTLIRHTPTQKIPRLLFSEKAGLPLNKLISELKKAILNKKNAHVLDDLKSDKDLYVTVEKIQQGLKIQTEALGEKEIFSFLVYLNDLVRISPIFGLTFPFDQYQDIDQLPVIEIEFSRLQDAGNTEGKLILLDTPGPNEAGQAHLRPMLQEQLKRASAVLAVMDYTQLKSEADEQVRDDLKSIAGTVKDRMYALVNKFDNCDRNGMQADEVKTFVEGLTDGLIKEDRVYPIAAKLGYLANRARHERDTNGLLPEITDDTAWVEDFYQEAGLRREASRTPERIAESIDDLWGVSNLSKPLKDIIESSYDNAAFLALKAAVDKLDPNNNELKSIFEFLELISKISVNTDLQVVFNSLDSLTKEINKEMSCSKKISRLYGEEKKSKKNKINKIMSDIRQLHDQVFSKLDSIILFAEQYPLDIYIDKRSLDIYK